MQIIVLFIPLLLVAFWLWMFNDMLNSGAIPSAGTPVLRWPPAAKNQWLIFFVIFSIFTAGYYYFTEYKK